MTFLPCAKCEGSGVFCDEQCGDCAGSGNFTCENRGCADIAVGFNEDGKALCEDCMMEWMADDPFSLHERVSE